MKSITLTIENQVGLHARPATLFVEAAQQHEADITVSYEGTSVNAKSILSLLTLGVTKGGEITVAADGGDEEDALRKLAALVESNFGE
jgi:phosphocarrier protein HPr